MSDRDGAESEAVQCLLSCSSSSYRAELFAGPPRVSTTVFSRWENVRPCAEYDLTDHGPNSSRKRKRRSSNHLARGAISLPNIPRSKFSQKRFGTPEPYMSGSLDENFSYVYAGGLSDRSSSEDDKHQKDSPVHRLLDPLQNQESQSLSTLTLDPAIFVHRHAAAIQMNPRTRDEISRIVAMQLKPEVIAEQLVLENRLRNLELNAFPQLGMRSDQASGLNKEREYKINIHTSPLRVRGVSQLSLSHRKKKRRKPTNKSTAAFEWCPLAIQECSSTDLPTNNDPFNTSGKLKHSLSITSPTHHLIPTSSKASGSEVSGPVAIGLRSPATKKSIAKTSKIDGSTEQKEKTVSKKTLVYYGRDQYTIGGGVPSRSEDKDQVPYRIPVVVPTLKQEKTWRTNVAKRVESTTQSRLAALHHPPTKFMASSTFTE